MAGKGVAAEKSALPRKNSLMQFGKLTSCVGDF
jgi:hypothetical protein